MVVYGSNSEHNSKMRIVNKCYLIKRKVFFAKCSTGRFAFLLRECCWGVDLVCYFVNCCFDVYVRYIYGNGITIENGLTANGMSQELL